MAVVGLLHMYPKDYVRNRNINNIFGEAPLSSPNGNLNYELRVTNYELRITSYELRVTNYELRITK